MEGAPGQMDCLMELVAILPTIQHPVCPWWTTHNSRTYSFPFSLTYCRMKTIINSSAYEYPDYNQKYQKLSDSIN